MTRRTPTARPATRRTRTPSSTRRTTKKTKKTKKTSRSRVKAAPRRAPAAIRGRDIAIGPAASSQPLDDILSRVIAVETGTVGDGFVDRAADRGGPTMRGVTLPACGEFLGHAVTAVQMRDMLRCRRGEVDCRECDGCVLLRRFYREQYVDRFHFDRIGDPPLQALMVDWGVTSYGTSPVKALQRALGFTGTAVDGAFGPGTERALAAVRDPHALYLAVLKARSEFYIDCALNDPKVKTFMRDNPGVQLHNLRGWNRERVLAFLT